MAPHGAVLHAVAFQLPQFIGGLAFLLLLAMLFRKTMTPIEPHYGEQGPEKSYNSLFSEMV